MPYLVTCRLNVPFSPEVGNAFVAQCQYCEGLRKEGKLAIFAPFTNLAGGIAVLTVPTNEDATRILAEAPLFPYVAAEVEPLLDWQFADQLVQQMASKAPGGVA